MRKHVVSAVWFVGCAGLALQMGACGQATNGIDGSTTAIQSLSMQDPMAGIWETACSAYAAASGYNGYNGTSTTGYGTTSGYGYGYYSYGSYGYGTTGTTTTTYYIKSHLVIAAGKFELSDEYYSDSACTQKLSTHRSSGTMGAPVTIVSTTVSSGTTIQTTGSRYVSGNGTYQIAFDVTSFRITIHTDYEAYRLSYSQLCGKTDWYRDTEVNVTGNSSCLSRASGTQLVRLDTNTLYLGNQAITPGAVDTNRPFTRQ